MSSSRKTESCIQLSSLDVISYAFAKIGNPLISFAIIFALGVVFLAVAEHSNLLIHNVEKLKLGYLHNFSWSVTMLTLFPIVFAIATKFYVSVPEILESLSIKFKLDREKFTKEVYEAFNRKDWPVILYVVMPLFWYFYFKGLVSSPSWIWVDFKAPGKISGVSFADITILAYLTCATQVILATSFIFLVRAVRFGRIVHKYIEASGEPLPVFHMDSYYGLSDVRKQIIRSLLVLWLLGLYIVSYLVDKSLMQSLDTINPISIFYVVGFFAFVSSLYIHTLEPFHRKMLAAKNNALTPISASLEKLLRNFSDDTKDSQTEELVKFQDIHERYSKMRSMLPEWFLAMKTSTILAHLIPVMITIGMETFKAFTKLNG